MSVIALIVPIFISIAAALVYAAISGAWAFRSVMAMFGFALCILMLPLFVHA